MLQLALISDLEEFFRKECGVTEANFIGADRCPNGMDGDLTVNCFRFARLCCKSPDQVALMAAEFLSKHPAVQNVSNIKAFVNLQVKPEVLFGATLANPQQVLASGVLPETAQKKVMVEYSAPNTNKPQHLGHVRNNTLGMSLASLLKRVGHQVVEINLVNDRGIHICKSMIAYERWGEGATPESTGVKGDHLVGKFYVKFNVELTKEITELKKARPELDSKDSEELFLTTELGQATQKMLQDWEKGDTKVRNLWEMMNLWVFAGFDQTYNRMGITFDRTYLESKTYVLGKDIVDAGLQKGVFSRRDDGAIVVDLGKLGSKVVLRSDGTSVYITQDIGTTVLKHDDYTPQSMIWVVGDEQNLHFQMLFEILRKLGYDWADSLYHLSYGMVNLPTGKMKSREGTVVDADDLFDEMCSLAYESCKERSGEETEDVLKKRGEVIGMGALKFMLLKFNPKTTIMFDPAASIKFEGDTGPYVQYACTRINSIERKAREQGVDFDYSHVDWSLLASDAERQLAVLSCFYGQTLHQAAEKRDCSGLVEFMLDYAKAFNRFYRECPVLGADNEALKRARLALCVATREILADGLATLTIQIPDAM